MKNLNENIKKYRDKYGFSQEDLAKKLNVTSQAVSKWETNESTPSLETLILMAKIFYTSIDELVTGCETNENSSESEKEINRDLKQLYFCFHRQESVGSRMNDIIAKILPLYNFDRDYYWLYSARIILKGTLYAILEDASTNQNNFNVEKIKEVLQFANLNMDDRMEKIKKYFENKSQKVREYISVYVNSPMATANSIMSTIVTCINMLSV